MLHLTGFDLPLEGSKRFREWGTRTPGHPEYRKTPGLYPLPDPSDRDLPMLSSGTPQLGRPPSPLVSTDPGMSRESIFMYVVASDGDLYGLCVVMNSLLAGHGSGQTYSCR